MRSETAYATRAFNAGASGFVTKYSPAADFIEAVSKIASGGVYVDFATAHEFAQSFDQAAALPPTSACLVVNTTYFGDSVTAITHINNEWGRFSFHKWGLLNSD
ncbi:MAG: hypothetical protein P4L92_16260 [Rudaea sp.]|nr:hypothetical protein [Rudaea sp.]